MSELSVDIIYLICFFFILMQLYGCFGSNIMDGSVKLEGIKSIRNLATNGNKKQRMGGSLLEQILPILITPFLISSSLIPIMLISIKLLLVKSIFIGKIAVILMILNFFRRRMDGGGVYNHHVSNLAQEHYGYQGIDEPGIYVHKRRRKRYASL